MNNDLFGQVNIVTSENCHDSVETTAESNEAFKQKVSKLKKKRRFQNESNLCAPCYIWHHQRSWCETEKTQD